MISVIVVTYNRPELLMNRCLPSIIRQTVADWECQVIGDGTDDETIRRMGEVCAGDERFRFVNLPHVEPGRWGLAALTARNYGLDHARGEWIASLDDDDEFTPDHHAVLLEAAVKSGADYVYGISDTIKDGQLTGQTYGEWPPRDGSITNGANLYRTSLPFRYELDCWDRGAPGDADLWIRMREAGVKFHFEPRLVHHYWRNYP